MYLTLNTAISKVERQRWYPWEGLFNTYMNRTGIKAFALFVQCYNIPGYFRHVIHFRAQREETESKGSPGLPPE